MGRCLRCHREFVPRKIGHVFCKPACRHAGPRRADEPEPPSEEVIARLFDESRDPTERVREDDWHPSPDPAWHALDAGETLQARRRRFQALMDEGRL
jgi:hypothetical protein